MKQYRYILKFAICIIFVVTYFSGCANNDKAIVRKIANLHKVIYGKITIYDKDKDKKILKEALRLIDKAISLDENNRQSYMYKAEMLYRMGSYQEAYEVLNHILSFNKQDTQVYLFMGVLFEKQGDDKKSKGYYNTVLKICSEKIQLNENVLENKKNRVLMVLLLDGKERALTELAKVTATNVSEKNDLKAFEETIQYFDRRSFIDNY